jgi:uncharacterized membrane protein YjfL (UPF0719 family)
MDDSMIELVGQVLAYTGVGLVILIAGFFVLDLLTPGSLGRLVIDGNPNAAVLSAATLVSLGLIQWFAIFFTGAGWEGLDDALVYGAVGVGAQLVGFILLDVITPGKLGDVCMDVNPADPAASTRFVPATWVASALQVSIALIICASLT